MATQVKIKRGTTDATAPSGLTAGEMAINLVDKKLYVGGTAGTNVIFLDSTSAVGLGTANTFTALNSFSAGISASGATFSGNISAPNIVTVSTANTFTALQTFSAGISASSGVTFSGSIISTGYQISSGAINAQIASYSLVAGDNGKIVTMNAGAANNLTVPASLAVGFNCTVIQLGAGQTTIVASGTTLNSYQGYLKISGQHGSASIVGYTSNVYNVAGNLSA